jgi:hypothetical protein
VCASDVLKDLLLPNASLPGFCGRPGDRGHRLLPGVNDSFSTARFGLGTIYLEQSRWSIEEFGQVIVFALDRTEVDRKRQDCPFTPPCRIYDHFATGSLRSHILGGDSGDPNLTSFLGVSTVVTYKLKHEE